MMTNEQWEQLKPFAEAEAAAVNALTAAWTMNTQTDPRERLEQDAWLSRLRIEAEVASKAMADARKRILGV